MDQILIKELSARGIIGINPDERAKAQEILISITLFADTSKAGESDDVEDSVNYRTISKRALAIAETAQRLTVEALAADLAKMCLEEPRVEKVRIRVEKPGAVRFCKSVGVEIERSRADRNA